MRALRIRVEGVVQGVGFRPFVYRVAQAHALSGWVRNDADGVSIHAEGAAAELDGLIADLRSEPPPAAHVASITVEEATPTGASHFEIRASIASATATTRVSPDLPVCAACLRELFDPHDRRYRYPYINCTNCGPRYSIVEGLPYDRALTTMRGWAMCANCEREYEDPTDRRFHAQPNACAVCGPQYVLKDGVRDVPWPEALDASIALLRAGAILAIKGIGGYHLACDAANEAAIEALRVRKYRKERPFALMVRDVAAALELVTLDDNGRAQLLSRARPIVLAEAARALAGVAPDNRELGIMLAYTPLHHLLFDGGAPSALVMTSANRSSEPIAYRDDEALASLTGIADAFLVGMRPIARRVDDSIVRVRPFGPTVVRRARGLAPEVVARFPSGSPILALGADLKNAQTLVVRGQAFGGQHVGDLYHYGAREAFAATAYDLCAMYGVEIAKALIAHDRHPEYHSTEFATSLGAGHVAVQHHRAHVASVLAERAAWDVNVLGFAFDGTGYGDDGTIWGGEVFRGSLHSGLQRVAHLRTVPLPGGDAAARFPVQAAAGFLFDIDDGIAFDRPPFSFPARYAQARQLVAKNVRAFSTSSVGRLFDAVSALLGFTREQTFEGQAAMWLEHQARSCTEASAYAFDVEDGVIDSRPVLSAIVADRLKGHSARHIARAFHGALADAILTIVAAHGDERIVVSGGVFQNALLIELLWRRLGDRLWMNRIVPPNDGGISLGQAAIAALNIPE